MPSALNAAQRKFALVGLLSLAVKAAAAAVFVVLLLRVTGAL